MLLDSLGQTRSTMSTRARNGFRFVISCAVAALTASLGPAAAAKQLAQTTTTSPTSIITTPISRSVYTATLEASFDWGDLGWDWQKQLGIEGTETLWFRWKIGASTAAKGRWQISNSSNVLLAQGEVGAAQTAGDYFLFLINLDTLNLPPAPYN